MPDSKREVRMPRDADERLPTYELNLAGLDSAARFAAFAGLVQNSTVTRRSDEPFHVRARFWHLDTIVMSEQAFDAITFDRTAADAAANGADHYSVVVAISGSCTFHHGDDSATLEPGRVGFSDFSTAERVETTALHSITIQIARSALDRAVPPIATRGPLPDTTELRVFHAFCRTLVDLLPTMGTSAAHRMGGVVRDLLAAALIDLPRQSDHCSDTRVRSRVIQHLRTRPPGSVTVAAICEDLGLTRSSLFRAFRDSGGVLAYDRHRRLHALHRALTDPGEHRGIGELSSLHGFGDKTHLSRLFRKVFGYSASQLRDHPAIARRRGAAGGDIDSSYIASLAALADHRAV